MPTGCELFGILPGAARPRRVVRSREHGNAGAACKTFLAQSASILQAQATGNVANSSLSILRRASSRLFSLCADLCVIIVQSHVICMQPEALPGTGNHTSCKARAQGM